MKYFCRNQQPADQVVEGVAVIRLWSQEARPPTLRLFAVVASALAVVMVAGCARSVDGTPVRPSARSFQPNKDYDISQLSRLENQFPPGFNHVHATPLGTLGPAADKISNIGLGAAVAVDPPECQSLLQPVRAPGDAQFMMVIGMGNGAIAVSAVKSPSRLPETSPPTNCDHAVVTRKLPGRRYNSTVTHLSGPFIEGVATTGSMDSAVQAGNETYVFAGLLSDRVAVAVQGLGPRNPQMPDILQDMLVKAVDAIRGQ
jgi:hypothetical protein